MTQVETTLNATRRGILSGAATAAVLPAAAMAQPVDPLLAIVAPCRTAFEEFGAASMAADEVNAERGGYEVSQAAEDRLEAASDALDTATKELISTAPVTKAGLAAAVAWLLEYDIGCIPDTSGRFLRTLAQSGFLNT